MLHNQESKSKGRKQKNSRIILLAATIKWPLLSDSKIKRKAERIGLPS